MKVYYIFPPTALGVKSPGLIVPPILEVCSLHSPGLATSTTMTGSLKKVQEEFGHLVRDIIAES